MKLLTVLLALFVAANSDLIRSHEELSKEKVRILLRIGEFVQHFNAHDWEALADIFDDEDDVIFEQRDENGRSHRKKGREQIKDFFAMTPSIQQTTMYTRATHVKVNEEDGEGHTTCEFFFSAGNDLGSGRSHQQWVKRGDDWFMRSEMTVTRRKFEH